MNRRNQIPKLLGMMGLTLCVAGIPSQSFAAGPNRTASADALTQAQSHTVTGTVVDESGQPLIGATVSYAPGKGSVTDLDGKYTITNVPAGATLTVSYVGYKEKKLSVGNKSMLNIQLQPDSKVLEDVVVIGYGVQKKSNVTGAISGIKSGDLENKVNANAAEALQGKVSGVQVVNNSGAPGASPSIRVRGYSSNGNSEPLYVVDGLKVSDISYLEPSAIESIEVLKDAASAAIYGAEAGNGVVLITTKNGGEGKTQITFDAMLSYSSLAKKVDMMNAKDFIQYNKELSAGFEGQLDKYYDGTTDTDWQDVYYHTGVMQKYNLGVSGNNSHGSFYTSLGYMQNNGMVVGKNDLYKRFTMQINASYNLRPWIEVGTNNSLSYIRSASISEGSLMYGQMANILRMDPLTPVEYPGGLAGAPSYVQEAYANGMMPYQDPGNGNFYGVSWSNGISNPVSDLYRNNPKNRAFGIYGMTYANFKPFKGFVFTSRLGYRFMNLVSNNYIRPGWFNFVDNGTSGAVPTPYLDNFQHTQRYYQWENFFNYNFTWKKMDFGVMAGMSYSDNDVDRTGANTDQLSNTASNFRYLDYSTANANDVVYGYNDTKRQIAYYGRLSWSFLNRYNVQVNFRADSYDSHYLDLDHNWGYFPSVSAGWTFTNEKFMKNLVSRNGLTSGKLRLSWGKNGSISNLGEYQYAATLASGPTTGGFPMPIYQNSYYIDGKLHVGTYPGEYLANPSLRWEESKQFDLGIDLRFLNDRLTFTMDYYNKLTDGLLARSVAPLVTGTNYVYQNLGKVKNTGFEFEAEWRDHIGDFTYDIKGNLATVKNKVTKFRGKGLRDSGASLSSISTPVTYFEEGYPLWYIRGYQLDGVDEATGKAIYHDFDNDGEITDADRTNLGKGIPDFTYGISINLSYKNFDFSAYGAGASGNSLIYGLASGSKQKPMFLYNGRWTESNHNASLPSAVYQNDEKFYSSSAMVFSASYFKIKQIQLGYTLPKMLLNKIGVNSIRAYFSLDNFFTITNYPGNDPEAHSSDSNAMAVDMAGYPIAKSVSFGINVGF